MGCGAGFGFVKPVVALLLAGKDGGKDKIWEAQTPPSPPLVVFRFRLRPVRLVSPWRCGSLGRRPPYERQTVTPALSLPAAALSCHPGLTLCSLWRVMRGIWGAR